MKEIITVWNGNYFAVPTADGEVSRSGARYFCPQRRVCFLFFVSDGPISFNSERNGGKNAGKNCVFAFPHALCRVKKRECLPHVRGSFPVSFRQRTVSATAPLPLTGAPNNAFGSTVATVSGAVKRSGTSTLGVQRRKRDVSSSYDTTTAGSCERVGKGSNNK